MSKQSFHQRLNRYFSLQEKSQQLVLMVTELRRDHPRMSSRQMHRIIQPSHIGRDRFEAFCFANGFKVPVKRSYHKTTNSLGVTRFENLLGTKELTGINQVWVSDITYYRIGEKFYYLTFIMDMYSRVIVGYSIAADLSTVSTTLPAMKKALRGRKVPAGLIFHSDGGGQYYCKEWLDLTRDLKIRNSMCDTPYENPHAERINGIIKNDYLAGYGPSNLSELETMTGKAVSKYNSEKPHGSLGNISPNNFERSIHTIINMPSKRKKVAKKEKTQECG
jgi:putative transposase